MHDGRYRRMQLLACTQPARPEAGAQEGRRARSVCVGVSAETALLPDARVSYTAKSQLVEQTFDCAQRRRDRHAEVHQVSYQLTRLRMRRSTTINAYRFAPAGNVRVPGTV